MIARTTARAVGACALLLASTSVATMAAAQTTKSDAPPPKKDDAKPVEQELDSGVEAAFLMGVSSEVPPPERASYDENGVNVTTATYRAPRGDLSIGSGIGTLTASRVYNNTIYRDSRIPTNFVPVGQTLAVNAGAFTQTFENTSSGWKSIDVDGATLTIQNGYPVMTTREGVQYVYAYVQTDLDSQNQPYAAFYRLSAIVFPNGLRQDLHWITIEYCRSGGGGSSTDGSTPAYCQTSPGSGSGGARRRAVRLQAITNTAGYQIHFDYKVDTIGYSGSFLPQYLTDWQTTTAATGINTTVEACSPTAFRCSLSGSWPRVAYATTVSGSVTTETVTDAMNRVWTYTRDTGASPYEAMRRPGSSSDDLRVNLNSTYTVTSVVRDGATWTYAFSTPTATTSGLTVTGPTGRVRRYEADTTVGLPTKLVDEYGRQTLYSYDPMSLRLATTTSPGGQTTTYTYDARGNVTQTVVKAVGGGELTTGAAFPASCLSAATCNQPTSTTDERGVVTTYTYDAIHGGATSALASAGGLTTGTQTRYTQVSGVWLPQRTWSCRTAASCDGTSDAVQTTTAYGANLLPTSVTSGAGDGSLTATTTLTYTEAGDVKMVDGPLPGGGDMTRSYYTIMRQPLGLIGPDPDGGGPRPYGAVRYGYDAKGRRTTTEAGTATSQSNEALSGMTVLQTGTATLDAAGRVVSQALSAGGTTYSRVDTKYDAAGYVVCQAQRMNPSALGYAQDACTVGGDAGYGPDRVVLTQYSPFGGGQPASTSVTSGYGTAEASTETVTLHGAGTPGAGQVASVSDGRGNATAYGYDGFGRPTTTTYPAGSQEHTIYAANGDVQSVHLRDGGTVSFGYDPLGRRTTLTFANGSATGDANRTLSYDLLGRVTGVSDTSGRNVAYGYDALGRVTSETGPSGMLASQYDAAGRRTRLTWSDGFFVTYAYDATGAMTSVTESGGLVLASYGYDALGRRVSRALGNGTSTSYGYDAASRLTSLALNGGGNTDAVTLTYGPAGQIATRSSTNDAYAYPNLKAADRNYTVNALNQYTASGPVLPTYDLRGNLTSGHRTTGSQTYAYDSANRLTQVTTLPQTPSSTSPVTYDAAGRLYAPIPGEHWEWDGSRLVTERNANGGITRRYVHGAGVDEPIVQYDGTGTRIWLDADERGSIVRLTNDAGSIVQLNSYDEYGVPGANNLGRFQYTGQTWLSQLGLYYYKARMYSPTLGRFLQTDPIGYGDGLNLYDYVGGDPVNATDPTGLLSEHGFIAIGKATCPDGFKLMHIHRDSSGNIASLECERETGGGQPALPGPGVVPTAPPSLVQPTRLPQNNNNSGSVLESRGKKMSAAEREKAREADYKICRVVNTRACWASAAERDAARATGRPVPPLQTGIRDNWSGRDLLRGAGAAVIVGGVICFLAEPCGAAVLGGLMLGGGAVILTN